MEKSADLDSEEAEEDKGDTLVAKDGTVMLPDCFCVVCHK